MRSVQVDSAQGTPTGSQSDYQRAFYAMKVQPMSLIGRVS
jgi:hypothetical protein